ncbi:hypothetical protein MNB_SV-3-617 [hydrothermal vent metagenome]|uniref:Periplasmic nitrate reductase component NapL n=1 Tax=hydrothermal vent metagenome TaxID=652676 RepID=A0A1W1CVS0_9ZZZZ
MRKYLPIVLSILVLAVVGYFVVVKKELTVTSHVKNDSEETIGGFHIHKTCARPPQFLNRLKIPQPVLIDLSQKHFRGIAFHYGKSLKKTLYSKQWKQYEHFSTYTLDEKGNLYLVPMPFISITPATFNLQKNIYKLDSKTGKLSIFMHFDDIFPSSANPFGMNAITYDCEDKTLWIAAIDESDYQKQKGVIYHVNPKNKEILQKIKGFDVLSMMLIKSEKGKYLLVGSARDNGLYAYQINNGKVLNSPQKLLELPIANENIRKIKVKGKNILELQTIPFSYALITQTAKNDRSYYEAYWDAQKQKWKIQRK